MARTSGKKAAAGRGISAVAASAPQSTPWFTRDWFRGLLLALAVAVVYQPIWRAGFIWDDDDLLTASPTIIGPLGFKDIWTSRYADIAPFTRSTLWLEHSLWGFAPLPYHLVNVLLHAVSAILLWQILRKLNMPGAWLGAALWALHPVQVESVAWITEMKNTESGLFFLLSILFFVDWIRKPGRSDYVFTLVFAALAMASKSSTVILPAAFVLCAWWMQGRWYWRNLTAVIPVALMSVAASAVSVWTQGFELANSQASHWERTLAQRVIGAGDAVWFYLGKLLWPHPLMTVYPRWQIDATLWYAYLPMLAVIVVLLMFWIKRQSWARPWFFAFAWFLIALLPALGIFDNAIFRLSLVFDHFQYLACMGPLALAAAGMVRLSRVPIPGRLPGTTLIGAAVLCALGLTSWQRAWAYESQETLWTDELSKNPDCWAGYYTLGDVFMRKGQPVEAITQFRQALKINPYNVQAENNLGLALSQTGQGNEAVAHFRKALDLDPRYSRAYNNLGNALGAAGQMNEAIEQYQMAVKIDPDYAEAHNDLGAGFARAGRNEEAIAEYNRAIQLSPAYADAYYNLGDSLLLGKRPSEAIAQFQKALEIKPDSPEADNDLGLALAQTGRIEEAAARFRDALRLNPSFALARDNLARAEALLQRDRSGSQ